MFLSRTSTRGCNPYCFFTLLLLVNSLGFSSGLDNNKARFTRSPTSLFGGLSSQAEGLAEKFKSNVPITSADLNAMKNQIKGLDGLSSRVEQALAAEKQARNALKDLIEATKERISSLENALNPDENNFWGESQSCGGVIVAQTGRISYKKNTDYSAYERCIWTIRTNYRSKVKVHLTQGPSSTNENGFDSIRLTELPGENYNNTLQTVELTVGQKYVFKGPVLIVSFITDGSENGLGLNLEFEGIGKNTYTNTIFQHHHLDSWAETFSAGNINKDQTFQSTNVLSKSKRTFATIVINPQYKNVTQLTLNVDKKSVNLKSEECERSSLSFYQDFIDSNSSVHKCCGTNCETTEFKNNDGIFLSTFVGEKQTSSDFKFSWEIDTAVPSEDSDNTCGGVLSGRSGKISYKLDEEYASNERCTWIIHPTGKSSVKMTLLKEEFEDSYDFLTVTTTESGFSIDSEPKNIILRKYNSYNFSGPIIFLTFFSDGSAQGKGFELIWEDVGNNLHEESSTLGLPMHLTEESGTQSLSMHGPMHQVIVINPKYLDGSALHFKLEKLEADFGPICGSNGLKIFGSNHGNFSTAKWICENNEGEFLKEDFQTTDGILILVYNSEKSVGNIEFTWKKGSASKQSVLEGDTTVEQTEGCGGVLIGDSGRIDYKLNTAYSNNERCTWVIQSARRTKMTLRLLKDGFESCCDFLVATPLNPENGTISQNFVQINRVNKFKSFSAPVVFVTFYSDSSVGDHGFSLEFTTSGELIENPFSYNHQHLTEIEGSVSIPSENELLPLKNQIFTLTFSPTPTEGLQETNVSIVAKNLGNDKQCQKDSLGIYEFPIYPVNALSRTFTCSTTEDAQCDCGTDSAEVSETLKFNNRAFVAIIKSVESNPNKSFDLKWISTREDQTENSTTTDS